MLLRNYRAHVLFRTVGQVQMMQAFKAVCPDRNELHLEIATVIKVEWSDPSLTTRIHSFKHLGYFRNICPSRYRKAQWNGTRPQYHTSNQMKGYVLNSKKKRFNNKFGQFFFTYYCQKNVGTFLVQKPLWISSNTI